MDIDILEPVQPRCNDIVTLKREFGRDLSFWGAVGVRRVLARSSVRQAVEGVRETLIDGSGGSRFDLKNLTATSATVEISGGGEARVDASESIAAQLSEGSRLFYRGAASVDAVQTSGGSSIRKL